METYLDDCDGGTLTIYGEYTPELFTNSLGDVSGAAGAGTPAKTPGAVGLEAL